MIPLQSKMLQGRSSSVSAMMVVGLDLRACVLVTAFIYLATWGVGCDPLVVLVGIEPCNERLSLLGLAIFCRWRCFCYEWRWPMANGEWRAIDRQYRDENSENVNKCVVERETWDGAASITWVTRQNPKQEFVAGRGARRPTTTQSTT